MPGFEARTADKKTSPNDTLPAAPDQGSKQDDPQAARDKAEMSALSSRESKPGRPQRGLRERGPECRKRLRAGDRVKTAPVRRSMTMTSAL
jgi:hypothetical protein